MAVSGEAEHFLTLFSKKVKVKSLSCVRLSALSGSSVHGDSPGKSTGVGCHALFQGIFLTQGWSLCLIMSPEVASRFFTTSATNIESVYDRIIVLD